MDGLSMPRLSVGTNAYDLPISPGINSGAVDRYMLALPA